MSRSSREKGRMKLYGRGKRCRGSSRTQQRTEPTSQRVVQGVIVLRLGPTPPAVSAAYSFAWLDVVLCVSPDQGRVRQGMCVSSSTPTCPRPKGLVCMKYFGVN